MTVAAFVLALLAIALDGIAIWLLRRRSVHISFDMNGHPPEEHTP